MYVACFIHSSNAVSESKAISSANVFGDDVNPFTLLISSRKPSKSRKEGMVLLANPIKAPSPIIEKGWSLSLGMGLKTFFPLASLNCAQRHWSTWRSQSPIIISKRRART